MNTYRSSPLTESQLQSIDNHEPVVGRTLRDYEADPVFAGPLSRARSAATPEQWADAMLSGRSNLALDPFVLAVWNLMDGSTCYNDAVRLIARKH